MSRVMSATELAFLIPGLFEGTAAGRYPALETLLARSDVMTEGAAGYESALQALFPDVTPPDSELPVAALRLLGQSKQQDGAMWICADPVHLVADQSRVYLTAHTSLALSDPEASELVSELNRYYVEDGWEFVIGSAHRWYLRIPEPQGVTTTPLHQALGQAIGPLLPQGAGDIHWLRLVNEMQMLLHGCAVNLEREARGELPANGVWLWGAGTLPPPVEGGQWGIVWADDCLVRGLALWQGAVENKLPNNFSEWEKQVVPGDTYLKPTSSERQLLVFDALIEAEIDSHSREQWMQQWEENWAVPLLAALRSGKLESVTVSAATGQKWHIDRCALRRWWRRRRPLSHFKKEI